MITKNFCVAYLCTRTFYVPSSSTDTDPFEVIKNSMSTKPTMTNSLVMLVFSYLFVYTLPSTYLLVGTSLGLTRGDCNVCYPRFCLYYPYTIVCVAVVALSLCSRAFGIGNSPSTPSLGVSFAFRFGSNTHFSN